MSCYEWESGSISIPRAEWAGFKAAVRDAHNAEQKRLLALAVRMQEEMVKAATGQRNVDWRKLSHQVIDKVAPRERDAWNVLFSIFAPNREKACAAAGKTFADPMDLKGSAGRPPKPTKGMFPEANGKTMQFSLPDAGISFDDKARTVHWQVHENNHAIEHAREHPVAVALFRALDRMKWDTKSGGEIVGNNEYNRDSRDAGGGGNTVNARYGRAKTDWEKSLGIRPRAAGVPSGSRHVVNNFYGSPPYGRY
jgi:hypothetical protein